MLKHLILALLFCAPAFAQGPLSGVNGACTLPGQQALTQGMPSTAAQPIGGQPSAGAGVVASFPSCKIQVYVAGTQNNAQIYSDNNLTPTVLSNPFTANQDASYTFFISGAGCYDIVTSTGFGPSMSSPQTLSGVCPGGSFAAFYTPALPPTAPSGALGLLYPPTGLQGFYINNGTNWANLSPYDSDARIRACPNDGVTDAKTCFDNMQSAVPVGSGQSVNIPSGTYLIGANEEMQWRRPMVINGSCSSPNGPCTTIKLGPGAFNTFMKSTTSSDGGASDFSVFRDVAVVGTFGTCTATQGNATLASCNFNPAVDLSLSTGDYISVVGNATARGSFLWRNFVTPSDGTATNPGAIVGSLTSNSITLSGAGLALYSGTVTVMKSGHVVGAGIVTNASTSITGVTNAGLWQPGDPIQGCGIPTGSYVRIRNLSGILTINQNAGSAACSGNLTKGPAPGIMVRSGSVSIEDVYIDHVPGNAYDDTGAATFSPAVVADGNYVSRVRVSNTGGLCANWADADANAGTAGGFQCTRTVGGIKDSSFLGNLHPGDQVAGSDGFPYQTTNANSTNLLLNEYIEGGQQIPSYGLQTFAIGGQGQSAAAGGISRGTILAADGHMSPNFYLRNEQSESTASCDNASAVLYNVTNTANWFSGQSIAGGCIPSATTVLSVDKTANTITMSKNANRIGDLIPITRTAVYFNMGTPTANLNSAFSFGYSHNLTTINYFQLKFTDPSRETTTTELGSMDLKYRETTSPIAFTTDDSTASWDYQGTANRGLAVFPNGAVFGNGVNKADVRMFNAATCPTSGQWHRGSLALLIGAGAGLCQQTVAAKVSSGAHADITAGSVTLANQDVSFLGQCAPGDSITAVGIPNATLLTDQNTLTQQATATTSTLAVTCTRQPKAHVAANCDTASGTNTLLNCTTISGWLANDTISGTGIPANSFITIPPSGSTITISQNATATNLANPISDAAFTEFINSISGGNVFNSGTPVANQIAQWVDATHIKGVSLVPVAQGGTGTATPGLIAGTNVTVTGIFPNQTVNASGGGGGGSPGGSSGDIQYNNASSFGGLTPSGTGTVAMTIGPSISALQLNDITGRTQCLHADSAGNVTGSGSDCPTTTGGGTPGIKSMSSYSSAQNALAALTAGDTMIVNGSYSLCNGVITASNVTITAGYHGGVLQCNLASAPVLTVSTNGVEIANLTVQHTVNPTSGGDGIDVNGGLTSTNIHHNLIQKNYIGANLGDTSNSRFDKNYVQLNNSDGVHGTPTAARPVNQWYLDGNLSQKNLGWGYNWTIPGSFTGVQMTGPWISGWNQSFGNSLGGFAFIGSGATSSGIGDIWISGAFSSQDNGTGFFFDTGSAGSRNIIMGQIYAEQEGTYAGTAGFSSATQTPTNAGYGIYFTSSCDPTPGPVVNGAVIWEASDSGIRSDCAGTTLSGIQAFKNGMATSANSYQRAAVAFRASNSSINGGYFRDSGSKMINGVDISNSADKPSVLGVVCDPSVATCIQPTTFPASGFQQTVGNRRQIYGSGTPSISCSNGDMYYRTDAGNFSTVYGCKNAAWAAIN